MRVAFSSYVAIGDSFTEGVGDPCPDGGGFRGWADLFAQRAAEVWPGFSYANLAIRGRLFDRIVDEQIVPAIKQSPDLVSFAAGGNDVLRPGFNATRLSTRAHEVVRLLKAADCEVMLFTCADVTNLLPGMKMLRKRFKATNDAYRRVAARHDAILIDLWADDGFADPRLWAADRLHLNTLGHQRVAATVCKAFDIAPDPAWLAPLPAGVKVRPELSGPVWAGKHLAPWIKRRLTGKSSGDTVEPKRPNLTRVKLCSCSNCSPSWSSSSSAPSGSACSSRRAGRAEPGRASFGHPRPDRASWIRWDSSSVCWDAGTRLIQCPIRPPNTSRQSSPNPSRRPMRPQCPRVRSTMQPLSRSERNRTRRKTSRPPLPRQ